MAVSYLHGLETIELNDGLRPVETVKSSVIGLIGTAPNANPDRFPLNTPVPVFADAITAQDLGTEGTLLDAIDAIYSQGSATVVVTRVAEAASGADQQALTWSNLVGSPSGKTGVWSLLKARPSLRVIPKLLIAPGMTHGRPSNGVVDVELTEVGSGYTAATTVVTISPPADLTKGKQATARAQVVGGSVTAIVVTDPGFGYTSAPTVTITGAGTGATATADLGVSANPVAKALEALSHRLRAVTYVDGPGTNYQGAVSYRSDFGSQRVMVIDPGVLHWDLETGSYVNKPASAYAAGIQARIDEEKGFWFPFSNNEILNIGGPSRPVDFMPHDRDSEANMLNAAQVTTIIHDDGYRFWGLRGTGPDPLWAQMSVRRTADMIYESLERAERIRMDQPFSFQLLRGIQDDVRAYLRLMKARGALIGGDCWIDEKLNNAQTFAAGQLTVDFDLEPAASLEHLQFRARRNPEYYEDFIEEFMRVTQTGVRA